MEALAALQKRLYGGEGCKAIRWAPDQVALLCSHYGVSRVPSMQPMASRVPDVGIRKSSHSGTVHQFTISTSSLDREGDTIAASGWDVRGYLKNPVVLWAHSYSDLPVGTATSVWREGNSLKAKMYFASTPMAAQVEALLQDKVLRAVSVGFAPKTFAFSATGINFYEQELLEFSVVPVPANAEALLQAPASAKEQRRIELAAIRVRDGEPTPAQRRRAREVDLVRIRT